MPEAGENASAGGRDRSREPSREQKTETAQAPCDTLFYDGQCPLCTREIEQLRTARGADLALVDIHTLARSPDSLRAGGSTAPDRERLLKTLHLQRADGRWLSGADANVAAWEGTRQGRWLRILRWPLLRPIVDLVYARWADWRYRRLYGATDGDTARGTANADRRR